MGPSLGHGGLIAAAAFSGDGSIVLTGSWDRTARMWDVTHATFHRPACRIQGLGAIGSIVNRSCPPASPAASMARRDVWEFPDRNQGRRVTHRPLVRSHHRNGAGWQRLRSRARCGDLERSASCPRATRRAADSLTMTGASRIVRSVLERGRDLGPRRCGSRRACCGRARGRWAVRRRAWQGVCERCGNRLKRCRDCSCRSRNLQNPCIRPSCGASGATN